MNGALRLPLTYRVSMSAFLAMLALGTILSLIAAHRLTLSEEMRATEQQARNLAMAWEQLNLQFGGGLTLSDTVIRAGGRVLNGDDAFVDRLSAAMGSAVTVFAGDKRVATTIRLPDGRRAVHTTLEGAPHDSLFGKGEPYRGITTILGERYLAAYDPIRGEDGRVIGALFVGVKQAEILRGVKPHLDKLWLATGGCALLFALAVLAIVRMQLSPLERLRTCLGHLAQGRTGISVPGLTDGGEIGGLAQAVATMKDKIAVEQAAAAPRFGAHALQLDHAIFTQELAAALAESRWNDMAGNCAVMAVRSDRPFQAVAALANVLREGDVMTLWDERTIAILLTGLFTPGDGMTAAERLSTALARARDLAPRGVGVAIGHPRQDPDDLVLDALAALRLSAADGHGAPILFDAKARKPAAPPACVDKVVPLRQ